ncbi:SDR family NAD(P)-dependent oxidoreductase [Clostridium sp.]|uniref:SDR family NAD(P)-dependent oxidoreductase n=1 Tax=Clostridium sp. TaxID=1506 RepID=UPI003463AF7B
MKYTIITGATSGIGYDLSKVFALNKHNLILVARNKEKLESIKYNLVKEYSVDVVILSYDLSKESEINMLCENITASNMEIEYLVNNAGVGSFGSFNHIPKDEDLNIIDLNIRALTHMMKIFLPYFIEKNHGGILNVSSTAAFSPGPYMAVYYSSKAYVLSLTEALREELKNSNIKISALCPGPTDTNFQKNAKVKKAEFAKKSLMESSEVATIAYNGFMKGKTVIIPGSNNKVLALGSKILPRKLLSKIVSKVNGA